MSKVVDPSARFNLTFFPISSVDVDVTLIVAFSLKAKAAAKLLKFSDEFVLAYLVIIPVVRNPEFGETRDSTRYNSKERAYKIRRNIDFSIWQRATNKKRKKIFLDFMRQAVADIPAKYLAESDRGLLQQIVEESI